mmetsp:Transcript_32247/g.72769  ORF Transcript_32247/g.72769 Transcript_32247/m.72769 type:complete len:198 (-) Transcript_32247:634-1227(-)
MEDPAASALEQVQAALAFWSGYDLDGRRQRLDHTCMEIKTAKDAAQQSRKMLAESTKEFRKMTDAEKMATVKDLIKSYQTEVDTLTKRARASESAFYEMYKGLYEAPDPAPALKAAATARPRAAANDLEVQKLRSEVAEYESEFKALKNQEITIRQLEDKLEDLEEQLELKVNLGVQERHKELEDETAKKNRGVFGA